MNYITKNLPIFWKEMGETVGQHSQEGSKMAGRATGAQM